MCGIVNKKNFDRIVGCLVHQTFNVSLMGGMQSVTRADNKEGSKVKIEVTRVNYGRDSLPFIQGKLLVEEEGELVGYDSGIEVKSEAGTPTPTTPVAEKRKREEEEEVVESSMKKPRLENEDLTPTSKKGKKSKHVNVKEETEAVREDIKQEPVAELSSKKKKKKKDKESEKKDDVEVEIKQEPESSDIVVKKKKKKKNKERESDQIMSNPVEIKEESGLEEEATKIKKKSKKNKS